MIRHAGGQVSCDKEYVSLAAQSVILDYKELTADPAIDPSVLLLPFLPGYDPQISSEHESWVQSLRDKGHALLRDTLLAAIAQYRQLARWADIGAAARRCLELDPLNEEATLSLAEAMAMGGRKLAAIQILVRYREDVGSYLPALQLPASVLAHRISELLPTTLPTARDIAFVGRASLLVELNSQIRQLRLSQGSSYHFWGGPGIGKSRLVSEVARVAGLQGIHVLRVGCSRFQASSGTTLRQLSTELLQLPGAIGCAPSSLARIRGFLNRHYSALEPERIDNSTTGSVGDALVDLADAVSHEQPLLIVVEEASRIDRASQEPLAQLYGAVRDRPIMVISTDREPVDPPALLSEGLKSIELERLSRADSATLLKGFAVGRTARMSDDFVGRCVAIADGNPALLVDLGQHWSNEGPSFQFPQSAIGAINERFAQLTDDARRLLQVCAVFAGDCSVERVLRTGLYDQGALLKAIDELGRLQLMRLEQTSLLVADPFISSQLLMAVSEAGLQYLHYLAASSLEAELKLPKYGVLVWHCARHHKDAGNPARGLELLTECADHFLQESKLPEAIATLRRAREFCTTSEACISISERLIRALRLAEHWRHVLQAAQLSCKHRRDTKISSGDHGEIELALLTARWHLDQCAASIVRDATRCLLDESSSPEHRVDAAVQLLIVSHNMGHQDAMHCAHAVVSELKGRTGESVSTLTAELIYQSALGDLPTAEHVGEQLLSVAREALAPPALALTLRQVAIPLRFTGRFDEARVLLSEALAITSRSGASYGSLKAADMIGTTYLEQGRLDEAWEWYLKSVQWIGGVGDPQSATYSRNLGAKVALLQHRGSTRSRLAEMRLPRILKQSVLRLRCDELALWIGLSLEKGETHFGRPVINAFEHDFAQLRALGNQDFAAYVLANLKRTTSGAASAVSLLDEYISHDRREKTQLPEYLADFQQSLSNSRGSQPAS